MSIIDRNGVYYMRFRRGDGVEIKQTTGLKATSSNLAKAKAIEKIAKAEAIVAAKAGKAAGPQAERLSFEDAANRFLDWADTEYKGRWSTFKTLRSAVRGAIAYFAEMSLNEIGVTEVDSYKSARTRAGIRNVTLHRDLVILSQFFKWAIDRELCPANPLEKVTRPSMANSVRIHPISRADEKAYFEQAASQSQNLHDLTKLMLNQGCRPMELMSLRCDEVDLGERTLSIRKGKTPAARRTLYLTEDSYTILKRRKGENDTWIFPSLRNEDDHCSSLNYAHDITIEKAGLSNRRFLIYDFRHEFATRLAKERKCDLATLKDLMGHSSITMVMKYVHANENAKRAAMQDYSDSIAARTREGIRLVKDGTNK